MTSPTYSLRPRARNDLDEIWRYTALRWGLDQAEVYIRAIQDAIEAVAEMPERGQPCDAIRAGYRRVSAGSHVVFFRQSAIGIEVVRILHGRMSFKLHL